MSGKDNSVSFHINGKKHTVLAGEGDNSYPKSVLLDYIRNDAGLTGTKYMCREGGCGACVCVVKSKDAVTGKKVTRAVNSCLTPVLSCDGYDISTIERLGNRKDGYDIVQNRLVGFSGTQCGFCTPGMVMSMYGLMKNKRDLTMKEIEDNLDGNVCRCTGFRPILDAFKSLAVDATESIKQKCAQFEEISGKVCPMKHACCEAGACLKTSSEKAVDIEDIIRNTPVSIRLPSGEQWSKPTTLDDALGLVCQLVSQNSKYRLVAGNTSTGIYKDVGEHTAYIDLNGIPELREHKISDTGVVLGAGLTLSLAINFLKEASEIDGFSYCVDLAKHWLRVANVPVRNAGTIAGNLMIKHAHNDFPSDIFLTLEALGAKLTIATAQGTKKQYNVADFLALDMSGSVIMSIHLPSLPKSAGFVFRSYKITKRYQNAHAYVNGAIVIKVDSKLTVSDRPRICFGGINPSFVSHMCEASNVRPKMSIWRVINNTKMVDVTSKGPPISLIRTHVTGFTHMTQVHAKQTEVYLVGKSLLDPKVLQGALATLDKEIVPDYRPPDASPEYRKALAKNLIYKTLLAIVGKEKTASAKHASGGLDLEHNVTSGKQVYDYKEEDFPVSQPIPKLEGTPQCSGEAEYINDIRPEHGELFGAFVVSTIANGELKNIDASDALKHPGVVAFISEKDIPGVNNYMGLFGTGFDEVFVKDQIKAAGSPLGLILAESRDAAYAGVKKVKVTYTGVRKPVLTIQEAFKAAKEEGKYEQIFYPPTKGNPALMESSKHTISGEIEFGGQYHFQMEPQTTLCIPKEGSLDIYSATQFMDHVQVAVSTVLGVPNSNINVQVRRLGGGYGSKISRSTLVAAAAALGAHVTNRPVRIVLDLETNMNMIGKRPPYWCNYKVGFDDNGKIENLKVTIAADGGANKSETEITNAISYFQNAYDCTGWEVVGGTVVTNTVSNTYCRAPGTTQGIAMIESIMEHIAHYLKHDPLEIRLKNLVKDGGVTLGCAPVSPNGVFKGENMIPQLVEEMKKNADYEKRKASVAEFNKAHRWTKRGLSVVPMRYNQHIFSVKYPCFIAIYHGDGSVAVSHGGIEMGQGMNTKVAQSVSYALGVPLDKIKIKATNNVTAANAMCTGGALGSELTCHAALQACRQLRERMAPVKAKLGDNVSWEKLVAACHGEGVDLKASYLPGQADGLTPYDIWGLNLTEVEVDMLTGEFKIARVDLIEDAGQSISPEVDIGQVEGALVMGLGLWTLEKLVYDKETGQLLTNNTWEYKVPFAKDIPEDFRVSFLTNARNPVGTLGSKATGEPPLCMSIGVVFALKQAIDSARADAGNTDYYQIDTPLTPERILQLSLTSTQQFQL